MGDAVLLAEIVAATGAVVGTGLLVAYEVEHRADIAQSWRDGCAQLVVWEAQARLVAAAVWLWLLVTLLPPHGMHRREVTP